MKDYIEASVPLRFKPFQVPNFATLHQSKGWRQDGLQEAPSMPLSEIPNSAFNALVDAWVSEMYCKHRQERPASAG